MEEAEVVAEYEAGNGSGDDVNGGVTLALDDQLCFALYAASRAVVARYRPLLDELGLTYPQYLVMLVLWEQGEVPIKDIGAALQLDYGTLTPLLKRLEVAGLIRRRRLLEDERTVQVELTEDGVALRARAEAVPLAIGDAMGLGPEEFATVKRLLRQLTANVSKSYK
jgi:MarR family transcriptional regulator, organic hydroperoxide resistance regulator